MIWGGDFLLSGKQDGLGFACHNLDQSVLWMPCFLSGRKAIRNQDLGGRCVHCY